jgi:hypothetical protein
MTNATGVLRCVITARSTSAMAMPPIQVALSSVQRSGHDVYTRTASAATNHPMRKGHNTVRYQPIPELMS